MAEPNILLMAGIVVAGFVWFLRKEGWASRHSVSLGLAILSTFALFTYGPGFFSGLHAHAMFWSVMLVFVLTVAASFSYPVFTKERFVYGLRVAVILSLVYVAIDDLSLGPPAAGPLSVYKGRDICSLPSEYYSEDVAFNCGVKTVTATSIFQSLVPNYQYDPYSKTASLIVYTITPILLLLTAIRLAGFKKTEQLVFG